MQRLINTLDTILSRASIGIMTLLVLTVTFQVFMRYVIGAPVTFTEELSRFLLIWLGLLSASFAYRKRMHLAMDLMVQKLQGKQRGRLNILIHSLIIFFSALVLVYGGVHLVILTWVLDQHSPALGVSMSIVYLVLPVSGIAIILYAIDFIRDELRLMNADLAPESIK